VSDGRLVGIIGAGRLGQAMASTALRAGRYVVLANSRGPGTLDSVIASLPDGASAGTVEQATGARVVVLAVPWRRLRDAVQGLTWSGQIVLDATNVALPRPLAFFFGRQFATAGDPARVQTWNGAQTG
jgi:8-hydroxy-5-deazaflavin:NADPH oxidoreductase